MGKSFRLWTRVQKWYAGDDTSHIEEHSTHQVLVLGSKKHWTARLVRTLVNFHRAYWQWVWTLLIGALVTLAVSLLTKWIF